MEKRKQNEYNLDDIHAQASIHVPDQNTHTHTDKYVEDEFNVPIALSAFRDNRQVQNDIIEHKLIYDLKFNRCAILTVMSKQEQTLILLALRTEK